MVNTKAKLQQNFGFYNNTAFDDDDDSVYMFIPTSCN